MCVLKLKVISVDGLTAAVFSAPMLNPFSLCPMVSIVSAIMSVIMSVIMIKIIVLKVIPVDGLTALLQRLTLMLLVANLVNAILCKIPEK